MIGRVRPVRRAEMRGGQNGIRQLRDPGRVREQLGLLEADRLGLDEQRRRRATFEARRVRLTARAGEHDLTGDGLDRLGLAAVGPRGDPGWS